MAKTDQASPDGRGAWRDGWLTSAKAQPSPNFGDRPQGVCIDLVVLHSISLPPGVYGTPYVPQFFCNQLDWDADPSFQDIKGMQVSAHFFVQRDGTLWQFVSCDARAWHAGVSRFGERTNCNDFSIGIELEGLEGLAFDDAQYATLRTLIAALMQQYPVSGICGHEHVAPGRKKDPGPGFQWLRLQHSLGLADQYFPDVVRAPRNPQEPLPAPQ